MTPPPAARTYRHRLGELTFGPRPLVMGILNVTPDSFSDGGLLEAAADAVAAASRMAAEGADLLDVGAESTRPGHVAVTAAEEWRRLAPVLGGLEPSSLPPVSVDTYRAETAARALEAGAAIVNDVWGLQRDPGIAAVVAASGAGAVLMHNRDSIDTSIDIVDDILRFLERSLAIARRAGVAENGIMLDPGIGFGKSYAQSAQALAALPRIKALGCPVLVGLSRKGFIGALSSPPSPVGERLGGTIAGNVLAAASGADVVRVHDVAAHVQAMRLLAAVRSAA